MAFFSFCMIKVCVCVCSFASLRVVFIQQTVHTPFDVHIVNQIFEIDFFRPATHISTAN